MPIMVRNEETILFVHIPKCGGSSFEKAIKELGYKELLSIRGMPLHKLKYLNCTLQHMHAAMLDVFVRTEEINKIVTIVRNPYQRFLSEYSWQIRQGITKLPPAEWIKNTFKLYEEDNFIFDNHIRPQNEFILDKCNVFKLEDNGIQAGLSYATDTSLEENIQLPIEKKTNKKQNVLEAFEEHKELIIDFYKDDYTLLGYEK